MIDEQEYVKFLRPRLQAHSVSSYLADMRAAEGIVGVISHEKLRSRQDVQGLLLRLAEGGMPPDRVRNCGSAMHQYIAMVEHGNSPTIDGRATEMVTHSVVDSEFVPGLALQRPVIEDVLDVLQEIRKLHAGTGFAHTAFNLRQQAVDVVSSRELGKGRFANEASASHSIQDACSRRLNLRIAIFDDAVEHFFMDDRGPLRAILEPAQKDATQQAAVELFLGAPLRPVTKTEPRPQPSSFGPAVDLSDAVEPERRETVVNRIIRDTAMARSMKLRYANQCQVCGVAVEMGPGRSYSEGHHIRPLGQPHNGPDTEDNILVLCPNHHAQCDYNAIRLDHAALHRLPDHVIDERHIEYHNALCARRLSETAG